MILDSAPLPVAGVEAAYREWGSTCGPVAIAAALGLPLEQVRPAVSPGGRFKGYMGIRDIQAALARLGAKVQRTWSKPVEPVDVFGVCEALADATSETDGGAVVVMLRFCGPWDAVPRAAATYRHAFAYRRVQVGPPDYWAQAGRVPGWVCDANNICTPDLAPWIPAHTWRNQTLVHLLPKRSTGNVAIDWMALVEPVASLQAERNS